MRARLARGADALSVLLCAVFLWKLFLSPEERFGPLAALAGTSAIGAALLARRRLSTIVDLPIALFAGLTIVSAAVHRGVFTDPSWQPAADVVIRIVCFYGLVSLLRTARRLGAFLAFVVAALSVTALQVLADHVALGWGTRIGLYPSVSSWVGYPQIGLVVAIALSVTLAVVAAGRTRAAVTTSATLSLIFLSALALLYSRSALVTAAIVCASLGAVEWWKLNTRRLTMAMAVSIGIMAVSAAISGTAARAFGDLWNGPMYVADAPTLVRGRIAIWTRAADVIRDHPWLGVGPGNYPAAARRLPMPPDLPPFADFANTHAHNMTLHVAAESGIVGAGAFLLIWWRTLERLSRLWSARSVGLIALALSGALLAFFVRSVTDYFMTDGMHQSERIGLLLWTLFAAAVAVVRCGESPDQRPSSASSPVSRAVFIAALLAAAVWAGVALFVPSERVRGVDRRAVDITDFAAGHTVAQTFKMESPGLQAIDLQFSTDRPASVRLRCRLLTYKDYAPDRWTPIYQWTETVALARGRHVHRFSFAPVVESTHEMFQFQVQQMDVRPVADDGVAHPHVSVVGSLDDTLKDGTMAVAGVAWTDRDLVFEAFSAGSAIEKFRLYEASLPRLLRNHALQVVLLALFGVMVAAFAYDMTIQLPATPTVPDR